MYIETTNKELTNYISTLKDEKLKQKKVEIRKEGKGGKRMLNDIRTLGN